MRLHPGGVRRPPTRRPPSWPAPLLLAPVLLLALTLYALLPVAGPAPGAGLSERGVAVTPVGAASSPEPAADKGRGPSATTDTDAGSDPASAPPPQPEPNPGPVAEPGRGGGGRSWPLAGRPTVLRGWEPPAGPYGPGHRGVDLAAAAGDRVLAAADGRVSFAGRVAGRGVLAVEVARSGSPSLRITYEPVRALVEKGADVRAGEPVAVLEPGPFHCAAGCLHWGLRRGDAYLDPLSLLPPSLLRRGPSRLLPVFGVPEPGAGPAAAVAVVSRPPRAGPSRRRCPR
ncbi:peptidoglycan DD-metalloendopeptidase family protein [Streptomyces californicus]|uniref:peptidoglycan DD-metalloendopeptidase family protein n=1 Tax=Streptomyces californicus TaxID=67351 RepID=UPI0037A7D7F7